MDGDILGHFLIMITVICRCYNVENYIDKCINSILEQSYKDFELLIIDDKSTDSTLERIKKFNDPRIKIYRHVINKGIGEGTATGIENSSGEWLSFIDPDDWVEKDFLKNLIEVAEKTDSDVVGCSTQHYNYDYNIMKEYSWIYPEQSTYYGIDKHSYDKHGLTFNNKLIKKNLFDGIIINPLRLYEDYCNMAKAMYKANKYTVIPYIGYNYLHRKDSLTASGNNILYRLLVYKDWAEYSQDPNWLYFCHYKSVLHKAYKIWFNINKDDIQKQYPDYFLILKDYCKLC